MVGVDDIREGIFSLLKRHFGTTDWWIRNEPKITTLATTIPSNGNSNDIVDSLRNIRRHFTELGVPPKELLFLDNEIDSIAKTLQVSTYIEETSFVHPDLIERYATLGPVNEGVVNIHIPLNFQQSQNLSRGVYNSKKKLQFFITPYKTMYGKIVAQFDDSKKNVPLLVYATTRPSESRPEESKIFFVGEYIDRKNWVVQRELTAKFWMYKFQSDDQEEYVLLSIDELKMGDYLVFGIEKSIVDRRSISENASLLTRQPLFFVHHTQSRVQPYATAKQLFDRLDDLVLSPQELHDQLFTVPVTVKGDVTYATLKYPEEFKNLIWAFCLHSKQGASHPYPLHLLIVSEPGTGKSWLLDCLALKFAETNPIYTGEGGTLKGLVPSFADRPPNPGYLSKSIRFSFCDEFLRMVGTTRGGGNDYVFEALGYMNSLLEHQERIHSSGRGSIKAQMSSRLLAMSNFPWGARNVQDLIVKTEAAFMSRLFIYHIQEESLHVSAIRKNKDGVFPKQKRYVDSYDWRSIIDYCWSIDSTFDKERVENMVESQRVLLSEELRNHYDRRHKHHALCIMDGIIKTRCVQYRDDSFTATEEDYDTFDSVWGFVIRTWVSETQIKHLPVNRRKYYIPDYAQYVFDSICAYKRVITYEELLDATDPYMPRHKINTAFQILKQNELIIESERIIMPYYMDETRKEN